MQKILKNTAAVVAVMVLPVHAALAVSVTGIAVGSWSNVVDSTGVSVFSTANNDLGGVAEFHWGTTICPTCVVPPTPFDNMFVFDGVGSDGDPPWSAPDGTPFLIGNFSYRNGSTINSIGIQGVDLAVDVTVQTPVAASETSTFHFSITNTPNTTGDPVLDGDIVTVANSINPVIFTFLDTNYFLEVVGFSTDGGTTITSDFSSPEGQTASAGLYARVTSEPIPEPGTLALFGMGAFGAGFLRRRGRLAA